MSGTNHQRIRSLSPGSGDTSLLTVPHVSQPENLISPDGAVDEDFAELLIDLVHHHHEGGEETLIGMDGRPGGESTSDDDENERQKLPWWKRPSPWWSVRSGHLRSTSPENTFI
jgi:hypothetical protein